MQVGSTSGPVLILLACRLHVLLLQTLRHILQAAAKIVHTIKHVFVPYRGSERFCSEISSIGFYAFFILLGKKTWKRCEYLASRRNAGFSISIFWNLLFMAMFDNLPTTAEFRTT